MDNIKLLTSGPQWNAEWPYFTEIRKIIQKTKKYLLFSIYALTEKNIVDEIEDALKSGKNIECYLYNNTNINKISLMKRVFTLSITYSHFSVHLIDETKTLHAKIVVSDFNKIIVGSANMTFSGLFKNYEMGLYFENREIAQKISALLHKIKEFKIPFEKKMFD